MITALMLFLLSFASFVTLEAVPWLWREWKRLKVENDAWDKENK
jgi:hypothetical protein